MKKYKYFVHLIACVLFLTTLANSAHAVLVPGLTLSAINSSSVQLTVYNADPNVPVTFYYPSTANYATANIGTTNQSGYLTITINQGTYPINSGSPVYVIVDNQPSASILWPTLISPNNTTTSITGSFMLNPSSVNIVAGQSTTVTTSNASGTLSVPSNTNSSVATASVQASQIFVSGILPGSTNITVCASGGGCASMFVTVQPASTGNIAFSQNNVNLNVGQSINISITGATPFNVSSNSAPGSVTANISGNNLNLTGVAFGGANITICNFYNSCGNIYAYVAPTGTSVSTMAPVLSSFAISSNNTNNSFIGSGNTLTFTWSVNQAVTSANIKVAGSSLSVSGTGSGPYTATYTVTGSEGTTLPVAISFVNSAGTSGQASFALGSLTMPTPIIVTPAPVTNVTVPSSTSNTIPNATSGSGSLLTVVFARPLSSGSTGPDVRALQQRLKDDGLYSGPVTGTYGILTATAVRKYQAKHGLSTLGTVGPGTRKLLNQGI